MENNFVLDYNYHTHTKLCGHAGTFEIEDYINRAIKNGIKVLGFSCHVPVIEFEYQNIDERMHASEVDNYISTLKELKIKYSQDIRLLIGLEAEYDYMQEEYLGKLRDKVDYMVLGQHYVRGAIYDENYPLVYAREVSRALSTGIFDFIAHPDHFMLIKKEIKDNVDRDKFDKNALIASQIITTKSKEMGIPLEINLRGVDRKKVYPDKVFWNVVSSSKCPVIIGVDAHNPDELDKASENIKIFNDSIVSLSNINLINYDPISNRLQNHLDELFLENRKGVYTYQSLMANSILTKVLSEKNNSDLNKIKDSILIILESKKKSLEEEYNLQIDYLKGKWQKKENSLISDKDKYFYITRVKKGIEGSRETLEKQTELLNLIIETSKIAFTLGGVNKDNIVDVIVKLIEVSTSTNEHTKSKASLMLEEMLHLGESSIEKGSSLTKINPIFGKQEKEENNSGHVFRSVLISFLTLVVGFLIGYLSLYIK